MKAIWSAIKQFFYELDKILLLLCLCASSISCICLYSFYHHGTLTLKTISIQAFAVVLGLIVACVISRIDYDLMAKLWKLHMPFASFLVILTYFIGIAPTELADDKAWLNLFGITTFQPSELLKLSFVLTFALHLSKVGKNINERKTFLLLCLHGAVPTSMIMLQGDFGTALVFVFIFASMMFVAGLSIKWIIVGITGSVIAAPIVWFYVLPDYLQNRFLVAWHPEKDPAGVGQQQFKGRMAVGSGQLFGRGLFGDSLYFVPEAYNDFIFSYIGQTLGFIGAFITLLIILLLCVKMLLVAKMSKDKLGTYICVGVFAIFLFQSIINIGMVLCVIPVIGITLPLFSQGGTSVLISYIAIGMVMSVYRVNKKELMFD